MMAGVGCSAILAACPLQWASYFIRWGRACKRPHYGARLGRCRAASTP